MKLMTDGEAASWCTERGLTVEGKPSVVRIGLATRGSTFRVPLEEDATAIVSLAYMLLTTPLRDHSDDRFDGALLWMRRWEIWSETVDRVGYELLKGLRNGHPGSLRESPAQLFEHGEIVAANAAIVLPMLFQWDATVIPANASMVVAISHDGYLDVTAPDAAVANLIRRFDKWGPEVLVNRNRSAGPGPVS